MQCINKYCNITVILYNTNKEYLYKEIAKKKKKK